MVVPPTSGNTVASSSTIRMVPHHLIYPATLPNVPNNLSVLSYNVLLPRNSQDGWWNYKMYQPNSHSSTRTSTSTSPSSDNNNDKVVISSWEYRSQLVKDRIQLIDPDVVCTQEVSPLSFESDFHFMN